MRSFLVMEGYAKRLGVYRNQSNVFNCRTICILLLFAMDSISITAHLVFDDNTFQNYTEAFFFWITLIGICIGLLIMLLKTNDIFKLLNTIDAIVDKRKFHKKFHLFFIILIKNNHCK